MTNLAKYDPFNDVWNLTDEVGRLFWGLSHHRPDQDTNSVSFVPVIDVLENNEAMVITAELPGLKKEDINIKVRDGVLTLSGEKKFSEEKKKENYYRLERSYGSFARSFKLPNTVDTEKINARVQDGILELIVPKKPSAQEREVQITVD